MKRSTALVCICIAVLALFPARAWAEEPDATPAPTPAASDDILRAQLRLRELGYYFGAFDGAYGEAYARALEAFCDASGYLFTGRVPAPLFSAEAKQAPFAAANPILLPSGGRPVVTGELVPWSEVRGALATGNEYAVTACYSGIVCKLRFLGGVGHARMSPALDWDQTTLAAMFGDGFSAGKQPVLLSLGQRHVAASLAPRPSLDGSETEYELYCDGSVSDLNGIPDVDHALLIRIAAGE